MKKEGKQGLLKNHKGIVKISLRLLPREGEGEGTKIQKL
jgi:hypothetical protein